MTRARKACIMCLVLGLVFVGLEKAVGLRVGLAGIYVVGMAAGIWVGEVMTQEHSPDSPSGAGKN